MLLYACAYGEYVYVEDYILRAYVGLRGEKYVCPLADLYLALIGGGLALFIECHHHHCCTERLYGLGLFNERFRSFLEAYGVDDAFALSILQTGQDGVPV